MSRLLLAAAAFFVAAGAALGQIRSDAAREQRWADQVAPGLVVGDAVHLRTADGGRFLALYAPVERARAAVLLAHGPGLHPDHGLTGELRLHLTDRGYTTLSLQMPVLAAEVDDSGAYRELFPEAALRIAAGMQFLRDKGAQRIAIVSHAMGSAMAYHYLRQSAGARPFAWAALSFYGAFDTVADIGVPILDLYGAADYRGIRNPAEARERLLRMLPGSKQVVAPDGGRFLAGGEKTVLREVGDFLDAALR